MPTDTPIAVIVDCTDGTVTERPLTAEEIAQREADAAAAAAAEEAKAAAKASAIAKLEALGLTADEASALLGV